MFVTMVTGGAEVVIGALSTFPANANDGLLTAGVTHRSVMLDACGTRSVDELSGCESLRVNTTANSLHTHKKKKDDKCHNNLGRSQLLISVQPELENESIWLLV